MRVALYLRESDADTTKAPSIDEQERRGRDWLESNGHVLVAIYKDNGYSGGDWKRPEWNRSVTDARRHFYGILWVWNQDRIARDTEQFLWYYRQITENHARIFEDTSGEFIDMETLGGRVKHQTLAQAAEIFRLVTSDKVRKAYQQRKKAGRPWGRRPLAWDREAAERLRAEGKGWRTIGKELGVSYQVVRRALLNRVISNHHETTTTPPGINDPENDTGIK